MNAHTVLALGLICGIRLSAQAQSAQAAPAPSLAAQIAALTTAPAVSRAHWGVDVIALDGSPIASLHEGEFFQPASNTKLYTTAAAMALLGPDRTVTTRIRGEGTWRENESLTGNLVLDGAGDANLNGRDLPYISPALRRSANGDQPPPKPDPLRYLAAMADSVAATGLRSVQGDVVGNDTLFPWEPYAPDWSIEDTTWYYGAPISALMINDNQVDLAVTAGPRPGSSPTVTITPDTPPFYTLDVSALTTGEKGSGTHVAYDLPIGSRTLRLYGSIAVDAPPELEGVAIHDPAVYGAMALKSMLEARGITITGVARAQHRQLAPDAHGAAESFTAQEKSTSDSLLAQWSQGGGPAVATDELYAARLLNGDRERVLATHLSPTLGEDVVLTNKVSQNQHAELMLHTLGKVFANEGSGAAGAGVIRAFLIGKAGLDPGDFVFFDGSGLSGHDLVTPRATARLLQYASTQPWFAAWKSSLPLGGVDGGLATRFSAPLVKGKVWAKTGTLGEARALSGYLQAASGRMLIFSVMVSSHAPGGSADRDVMDRIVTAIAAAE